MLPQRSAPSHSRSSRRRTVIVSALVALGLVLGSATYADAHGAPRWLARWFRVVTGRLETLAPASAAPSDTVVLFGPKTMALGTGTSATFVEKFTVPGAPPNTTTPATSGYLLKATNGGVGLGAITGGTISLNGAVIVSGAQLAALSSGSSVIVPVQLAPADTIVAALTGPAGSGLSVSVLAAPDPTFLVFGAKQYERANGAPVTITERFTVPVGGIAPSYLCVRNGEVDGTRRNSSAIVRLNGVDVVTQSELNQQVAGFTKRVSYLPAGQVNVLEVQLQGAPGSRLTLCATATDAAAPTITVTAPAKGLITRQTDVDVVGVVNDQTAVAITVNGAAATVAAGTQDNTSFTLKTPLATEGANTITIRAVDAAGNRTDSVRTVIRDTQAPVVTLDALPDSVLYRKDSVLTVTGTITDLTKVTANVNGVALVVDSTTHAFSQVVQLAQGTNFVSITATDAAGNATSVVRQVTLDNVPPTLTLTAPAQGLITRTATATVLGSAVGQSAVTVTVNGANAALGANGAFTSNVALTEGSNSITVVATNAAGVTATATRTVILDTQAPALTWSAPADNAITKNAIVDVTGSVYDQTPVTLTLNGAAVALTTVDATTKSFLSLEPVVDDGPASLTLVATDAAGNVTTLKRTVTKDATAPVITVIEPAIDLVTNAATAHVVGSVADLTASTLTVNGAPVAIATDGGFVGNVLIVGGANTLTFVATDAAGNQTTVTRSLIRDVDPPVVTIASPSDNVLVKTSTITVNGTITDASAVTATLNGAPLTIAADRSYTTTFALSEGPNTLTLVATDAAGNATTTARSVTLDTQAPVLTVTSPVDGSTTQAATVMVAGTAIDQSAVKVTVNGASAALGAGGAFSSTIDLAAGSNSILVVATDSAGNSTSATRRVTRDAPTTADGFTERIPIDASIGAPPPPSGVPATLANATAFLYQGPNAVQKGVAPGAIPQTRAAVIRGRLLTRAGQPLSGATVKIAGHPELGYTTTRSNGLYDLAVAGGGQLTVSFAKPGYLPAARRVETAYSEFRPLDDVVLVTTDSVATRVSFNAPIEIARGSVVQDQAGQRQATLMFRQGTAATMVLPNGTTQPLPSITVRATEFTVGPNGTNAMPASIADNTGYTYAVELSADEAIQAGATSVRFSKPVASYTDNFLNFPVGTIVPVGYYDFTQNRWIPQENGRVIKVLSTAGGSAAIDVTGLGSAATPDTLAALGVDGAELGQLAQLYQPGTSLWRVPLTHFSPMDYNMSVRPGKGSQTPKPPKNRDPKNPTKRKPGTRKPDEKCGCEISVQERVLGETFPIANTPFSLHYSTDRTPGFADARVIDVPITDDSLPAGLQKIRLEISVAGRLLSQEFMPTPNLSFSYTWDGRDAYGRKLYGPQPVTAAVSYYYFGEYVPSVNYDAAFGAAPVYGAEFPAPIPARILVPLTTEYKSFVGAWDARSEGLGGWTLSAHHVYDPVRKVLDKGDGTSIDAEPIGDVIHRVIGTRVPGHGGDGGPAITATIAGTGGLLSMPDGSIVFTDQIILRRVDSAGTISTVPTGLAPMGLADGALGPDGSIYFGANNEREYRYEPNGRLTEIYGGGGGGGPTDGADAHTVRDFAPGFNRRAVGPDGTFYMLINDAEVWRLAPNGKVYRVAGDSRVTCNTPVYEGPARNISICSRNLAVGPDNSIYVIANGRLIRIGQDGNASLVTGGPGAQFGFDNGPAIKTILNSVVALHANPDGSLLVLDDAGGRVRVISRDGNIRTLVGYGERGGIPAEGALATTTPLLFSSDAIMARDGSIYIGSGFPQIDRVAPALPGLALGQFFIPSEDGSEFYVFGTDGRHISTKDANTLNNTFTFQYNSAGALTSITDDGGLITTITPSSDGTSVAIVSGRGVKTTVQRDANGYANRLQAPLGITVVPQHDSMGLMRQYTNARGFTNRFDYDSLGQLTLDTDALGSQSLSSLSTATKNSVTHTSATGELTSYSVELSPDQTVTQTTTRGGLQPDSLQFFPNGLQQGRVAGSSLTESLVADPRIGWPVSYAKTSEYQIGSVSGTILRSRTRIGGAANVLSGGGLLLDSSRVNGRLFVDSLDLAARRAVQTSPQGRRTISLFDLRGSTLVSQAWSQLPQSFTYDSAGQLVSATEGWQTDSIQWNALGHPSRLRRADGAVVTFVEDTLGRILSRTFGGMTEGFAYDVEGHQTEATLLGGRRFTFAYDAHGMLAADSLASAGLELGRYAYDADGKLRRLSRPGRNPLALSYDALGRVISITSATIDTRMTYAPGTGLLSSISAGAGATGQTYALQYNGRLPAAITASGLINGRVDYTYTPDLWLKSAAIAGRAPITYDYDADGLVTRGGVINLKRDPVTGAITGDSIGVVATTRQYDDHGALKRIDLRVGGTSIFSQALSRDSIGRISAAADSGSQGATTTSYRYDALDRLDQVSVNGTVAQALVYDGAGNRLSKTTNTGTVTATYASDDRILSLDGFAITHDSSGARQTEVTATDSLAYDYDDLGRLTRIASRTAGTLTFQFDALGRRVQELRNGSVARQFVYGIAQQPVAELTNVGAVRSEFIYVSGDIAPDYVQQGSTTLYLLHDQLGSVRKAIDVATGAVVQELEYDATGNVTRNTNPGLQPFGYAGGLTDLDGRLLHFGARDYDARTGRWLEADPIGAAGGGNRYTYASSDPVNFYDPSGLKPCPKKPFLKKRNRNPDKNHDLMDRLFPNHRRPGRPASFSDDMMTAGALAGATVFGEALLTESAASAGGTVLARAGASAEMGIARHGVSSFFAGASMGFLSSTQLPYDPAGTGPSLPGWMGFGYNVGQLGGYIYIWWKIKHP